MFYFLFVISLSLPDTFILHTPLCR